jgi:hypothetical protein
MKSVRSDDPARWCERDADAHALEARAAVLADAARPVQPLAARAVARIRAEVEDGAAMRQRLLDFRRLSWPVRVAVGLALLLIGAATADGAAVLWRKHLSVTPAPERLAPAPARETPPRTPRPLRRAVALDVETPPDPAPDPGAAAVPPSVASAEVSVKQPVRRAATRERSDLSPAPAIVLAAPPPEPVPFRPEPPAAPESKTTEAAMVAQALSQLRQEGDPRAALATLDAYARAFPHGVLEIEALRTRAEAVIRLDDRKTALALLDAMPGLADSPGTDLLLTRAELRAAGGRFGEALADFTRVVDGQGGAAAASERALYGRAVCFGRLAEGNRARADLLAYERRFPSGRFAVEVRRLLSESGPSDRP